MAAIRDATQGYTASGTSVTITTPTGAAAGDILLAFIYGDMSSGDIVDDSGLFTQLDDVQGGGSAFRGAAFSYVLPGSPAANYTFSNASNLGNFMGAMVCVNPDGDTYVGLTDATPATAAATGTVTTGTVTGVADPSVLLAAFGVDDTATVSSAPASMDLQEFVDGDSMDMAVYTQLNAGTGSLSKSITWSGATEHLAFLVLLEFSAAASGPVIDSQPTAQTAVLSGPAADTTVRFECSAVDDVTAAAWDLEDSVGGGAYSELTDAGEFDIAISLNPPLTTLDVTPADTGDSGKRVRARLTDAGGETTSDAVALTVYAGDTLTQGSATTNASGERASESTLTSDYSSTGRRIRITRTAGGVTIGTHTVWIQA